MLSSQLRALYLFAVRPGPMQKAKDSLQQRGRDSYLLREVQDEFTHSPDFLIAPMLSLIFQISPKSKYQNIFVLMRNPTAPGGTNTIWGEIQTQGV